MNLLQIEYKIKSASHDKVRIFLKKCAQNFVPPLDKEVEIEKYSQKLYDLSVTFEAWSMNELVGLVAGYFNNIKTKAAFISSVSVLPGFQNSGIATKLLQDSIDYAQANNFVEINLEVNKMNKKALKLYEKYGFLIFQENGTKVSMKYVVNKG